MASLHPTTIAVVCFAALAACNAPAPTVSQRTATPFADTATPPVGSSPERLPVRTVPPIAMALANADYIIEATSSGRAMLRNGQYEEAVPDSSSRNVVRLGPERAYGDLDGDGAEDAAVTLLASSGGSGTFTYLAVVLNKGGAAVPVASMFLGDRITLKSMRIVDGQMQVSWLERKPGEPMSTPPLVETSKAFVMEREKIVPAASAGR